jgi:HK97 family phage prohead protease
MGLLRWFGLLGTGDAKGVRTEFSESAPRPIDALFAEMREATGRVTRDEALSVPAVQKGRNMICSVATLPLRQIDSANREVPSALLGQIDPDVPNVVTLTQTVEDLLFDSIAWWRITSFDTNGFPLTARHLVSGTVSLNPPGGRSPSPLPSGEDPRGAVVYVDGEPVSASLMIRFDSPNPAVLTVGGRAIRRAILLDKASKMYAEDPRPQDYFSPGDGADPADDDEIAEILAKWRESRRKRATGYVPAALTYNTVDSPSPADLQLVELQRQAALDISNALGVDPEDLGISTTSRTYANAVDRRRDRINDVLAPFMRALTDRLSMGDVTRPGHRVVFNLDDYLKSNPTERWGVYEKAKNMGVLSVEEIRQMESLPPGAPGEDKINTKTPAKTAEPSTVDASGSVVLRFDNETKHVFADVPVVEFSVDTTKREIEGLALPYGKVASKYGVGFRFDRGSIQFGDVSRVKLLRDHDYRQAIGKAVEIKDTATGLKVKFKVARGPEGDRALELAEDGVLDGLSVGVDFNEAVDTVPDSKNKGGLLVRRADLREVSLTPMPAFDDARVTKVAASRDGGNAMPCSTCGNEHAPGVACTPQTTPQGVTLTADQFQTLMGSLKPSEPEPERQVVNPTRLTASTTVTEPEPYRLDRKGNLRTGSHDFSTDLFAAGRGDIAANDRALAFVSAQFDVATGDVNELNPTRQRPDLYVDQKDFTYPVWEAINKGTLGDITPFTFPKFSSASGLVGNHTEGSEPSSGTLVTTSQTVTPTAVSGKAKITRETWDQGGNPQVSNLLWRQMTKGWFEALEARAVALLDAATPTAIPLTAGGGTTGQTLSAEVEAAFAALQFIRGGFRFDTAFAQADLYKGLAAAKDDNGRPLYPRLGPSNANGTASQRFAAMDVGGVTFLPAWALAASGSVVASSYLFDSADVHGWASAPQRLDFNIEVAHVYIGLWGYAATAISDITGVREITYDPVA